MAKIVFMTDYCGIPTGYGRVGKELATAFYEAGHEISYIGWGYRGEPHNFPFEVIPCDTHADNFGEDILAKYIREEQPDILFTLGDPWMTEYIPSMEERRAVVHLAYFPIDGAPITPQWHNWLKNIDVPVVFSKYAYELVKEVIGKNPLYIPHGVDIDNFKPLENRGELKSGVFGRENVFVVGCVARNQPRKNLPALIKAFSQFAKKKDDVALYMHTQIRDVGWNIDELVQRFDVTDKAYCTNSFSAMNGVSDQELNQIYNIFDVMALPTLAEGFGLPILESQSAGVPVLVTDCSACTELTVSKQELIKVSDTLIMGRGIEQSIPDTDDLVRKLNIFYDDWKRKESRMIKKLGADGRKKAESMSWKLVNEEFIRLIEKIEPQAKQIDKTIRPSFYKL